MYCLPTSQFLFNKFDREFANADIKELADKYEFIFDLPGLEEKDIDIKVKNNSLTVSGHRSSQTEPDNNYRLIERSHGNFSRKFKLPIEVNIEKTEAVYTNGVLKITTPKAADTLERKVSIN